MPRSAWLCCCVLALPLSGCNDAPDRAPSGQDQGPVEGEQLLAEPPSGWVRGFGTETPLMRMVEFVPPDTGGGNWDNKVTFESLSGEPLPDPIDFVVGIAEDQAATCDKHQHVNVQSGLENGYPTSVRLMVCSRNNFTGQGQITLIKAIQGQDNFYVISRARRIPALADGAEPMPAEDMARWSAYMRAIKVCDTRSDAHPCPSTDSQPEPDSSEPATAQAPPQNASSDNPVTTEESP